MARHYRSKLNRLGGRWPRGTVAVYPWLAEQGISRKLVESYKRSRSLKALGHGAVIRPDEKVHWQGALYTLQNQLGRKIHAGGKTALEMLGFAHFVHLKSIPVFLFGEPGEKLPAWFQKHDWNLQIQLTTTHLFPAQKEMGLAPYPVGDFSIRIASPERAILETLHLAPQRQSYEESKLLMEGLATLRPKVVQKLIETCRSVKVKRLFLLLAQRANHPWFHRLDLSKVNLGTGKRVVFQKGHLDPQYEITIPERASSQDE